MDQPHYDSQYAYWKGWEEADFGRYDPDIVRYYDAEVFARRAPTGLRFLEIGFGNGAMLAYARDRGCQVCGVELNPELVQRAKTAGFDVFDNISKIDDGQKFDVIVAFDVLEHLEQGEIAGFLRSVSNFIAADGLFILRFPNADSPLSGAYQHGDISHITQIGGEKLRYYCRLADLNIDYLGRPATPRASGIREKIKQLVGNFLRRSIEHIFERLYLPHPIPFDMNYVAVLSRPAQDLRHA